MQGTVAERRTFDAFGKPRTERLYDTETNGSVLLDILNSDISNRGFTDHEHFDDAQLIHMNGRAYDYNLGRFLSVDPFIQDSGNSQSMNPYSYIMNNPLAGTDPSGYRRQSYTQRRGITFEIITGGWNPGADQEDIAMAQYQQCRAGGVGSCVHPYSFDVSGGSDSNQDVKAKKNKAEVKREIEQFSGGESSSPTVGHEPIPPGMSPTEFIKTAWDMIVKGDVVKEAVKKTDDKFFGGVPISENLGAGETIDGGANFVNSVLNGNPTGAIQGAGTVVAGKLKILKNTAQKIGEQVSALRKGVDVRVNSVEEAREILDNMPELKPGPGGSVMPGLRDRRNTYRGDLINKQDPGSSRIHPAGKHSKQPHYNIELIDEDGNRQKPAIFIDQE